MNYLCGSFNVKFGGTFRDYSDLEEYVTGSDVEGLLLGEDASNFMAFYAMEVHQPFTGSRFRIGIILDNSRGAPVLCPIHRTVSLAIGMNNCVQVLNLNDHSIAARIDLDTCLHHLLCDNRVIVAVHELGASVMDLSTFQEIANADCEVVADAALSDDELILISMDEKTTRVDLAVARHKRG